MAKVDIVRSHQLSFEAARKLAKSWMKECEQQYNLKGDYINGECQDTITFSRKGLSGVLTVTASQFTLELTLGFLFSAYQKTIVAKINSNMDILLN